MTKQQKGILTHLFKGANIAHQGRYGIRLRDKKANPIQKVNPRSFRVIKDLLRKKKDGLFIINIREVRKQRKDSWVRQEYQSLKK